LAHSGTSTGTIIKREVGFPAQPSETTQDDGPLESAPLVFSRKYPLHIQEGIHLISSFYGLKGKKASPFYTPVPPAKPKRGKILDIYGKLFYSKGGFARPENTTGTAFFPNPTTFRER
jgi:hypothetical protein